MWMQYHVLMIVDAYIISNIDIDTAPYSNLKQLQQARLCFKTSQKEKQLTKNSKEWKQRKFEHQRTTSPETQKYPGLNIDMFTLSHSLTLTISAISFS